MFWQLQDTCDFKLCMQHIVVIDFASDIQEMQQTWLQSEALYRGTQFKPLKSVGGKERMEAQLYKPFLGQTLENQLERLSAQHFG